MKNFFAVLVLALMSTTPAFSQSLNACQKMGFLGQWDNQQGNTLTLQADQKCQNLILTDAKANTKWIFDLSGKTETVVPVMTIKKLVPAGGLPARMLQTAHIRTTLVEGKYNDPQIKLEVRMNVFLPSSLKSVHDSEIFWVARVNTVGQGYIDTNRNQWIQNSNSTADYFYMSTEQLRLRWVDSKSVVGGEGQGFVQGANAILSIFKSLITATLHRF